MYQITGWKGPESSSDLQEFTKTVSVYAGLMSTTLKTEERLTDETDLAAGVTVKEEKRPYSYLCDLSLLCRLTSSERSTFPASS